LGVLGGVWGYLGCFRASGVVGGYLGVFVVFLESSGTFEGPLGSSGVFLIVRGFFPVILGLCGVYLCAFVGILGHSRGILEIFEGFRHLWYLRVSGSVKRSSRIIVILFRNNLCKYQDFHSLT